MEKLSRNQLGAASNTWESFLRVYSRLNREFIADGSFGDLPMREYDILYALSKASDSLTQSELLDNVVLSQPALSRMLKRMEEQGLIERCRHGVDGRASLFSLTQSGREIQRVVGRAHGAAVAERLYSRLTAEEVDQLGTLCRKLLTAGD